MGMKEVPGVGREESRGRLRMGRGIRWVKENPPE
jgi:hypothetical protein